MSDKEFFRAEYKNTIDCDGDKCIVPTVWMGNQSFELKEHLEIEGESAQEHAEWVVSMFKKALENYANQQLKEVLEEAENNWIENEEPYRNNIFNNGVAWILNHIKQRKG